MTGGGSRMKARLDDDAGPRKQNSGLQQLMVVGPAHILDRRCAGLVDPYVQEQRSRLGSQLSLGHAVDSAT